jgi:Flp pilus assembly protein TadG
MQPVRRWDEGGVAVEAAVTVWVLVLLIVGIIEFAYAFYQWNTMALVVQDVGRQVMVSYASTPCDATCAESAMKAALTGASSCTSPTAGQTCVSATTGGAKSKTMTLTASFNFNFLTNTPFTIAATSTVPLE